LRRFRAFLKYLRPSDTGIDPMVENYIIRLYRFEKDNPRNLVGLVEIVGKKGRMAFRNMDVLWEILNSSIGEEREEKVVEPVELGKKRKIA
jgi:hypothetical protein